MSSRYQNQDRHHQKSHTIDTSSADDSVANESRSSRRSTRGNTQPRIGNVQALDNQSTRRQSLSSRSTADPSTQGNAPLEEERTRLTSQGQDPTKCFQRSSKQPTRSLLLETSGDEFVSPAKSKKRRNELATLLSMDLGPKEGGTVEQCIDVGQSNISPKPEMSSRKTLPERRVRKNMTYEDFWTDGEEDSEGDVNEFDGSEDEDEVDCAYKSSRRPTQVSQNPRPAKQLRLCNSPERETSPVKTFGASTPEPGAIQLKKERKPMDDHRRHFANALQRVKKEQEEKEKLHRAKSEAQHGYMGQMKDLMGRPLFPTRRYDNGRRSQHPWVTPVQTPAPVTFIPRPAPVTFLPKPLPVTFIKKPAPVPVSPARETPNGRSCHAFGTLQSEKPQRPKLYEDEFLDCIETIPAPNGRFNHIDWNPVEYAEWVTTVLPSAKGTEVAALILSEDHEGILVEQFIKNPQKMEQLYNLNMSHLLKLRLYAMATVNRRKMERYAEKLAEYKKQNLNL